MKWPTIFEWLWDMNLYAPLDSQLFDQGYRSNWGPTLLFVFAILYGWAYRWWYRKNHRWRSVIKLTEVDCGIQDDVQDRD